MHLSAMARRSPRGLPTPTVADPVLQSWVNQVAERMRQLEADVEAVSPGRAPEPGVALPRDGKALAYLAQRLGAEAPARPAGASWDLRLQRLFGAHPWESTRPTLAVGQELWCSDAPVSGAGRVPVPDAAWSEPVVCGSGPAAEFHEVALRQAAALADPAPAVPARASYDFGTGLLAGLGRWSVERPDYDGATQQVWGTAAVASNEDSPDGVHVFRPGDWSRPQVWEAEGDVRIAYRRFDREATAADMPRPNPGPALPPAGWFLTPGDVPEGPGIIHHVAGHRPAGLIDWTWQGPPVPWGGADGIVPVLLLAPPEFVTDATSFTGLSIASWSPRWARQVAQFRQGDEVLAEVLVDFDMNTNTVTPTVVRGHADEVAQLGAGLSNSAAALAGPAVDAMGVGTSFVGSAWRRGGSGPWTRIDLTGRSAAALDQLLGAAPAPGDRDRRVRWQARTHGLARRDVLATLLGTRAVLYATALAPGLPKELGGMGRVRAWARGVGSVSWRWQPVPNAASYEWQARAPGAAAWGPTTTQGSIIAAIDGLAAGASREIRARAVGGDGTRTGWMEGPAMSPLAAGQTLNPPLALGATAVGPTIVSLSWDPPGANRPDDLPVDSYVVSCDPPAGSLAAAATVRTGRLHEVTGLAASTLYRFSVRALYEKGSLTSAAAAASATTLRVGSGWAPPRSPSASVVRVAGGEDSVQVTWDGPDPASGELGAVRGYTVALGGRRADVAGRANTTHTFEAVADGHHRGWVHANYRAPLRSPDVPFDVVVGGRQPPALVGANGLDADTIEVRWRPAAATAADVTGWRVELGGEVRGRLDAAQRTATFHGLAPATEYTAAVSAWYAGGESPRVEAVASTEAAAVSVRLFAARPVGRTVEVDAVVVGGSEPYSYSWSGGAAGATPYLRSYTFPAAGTYTVSCRVTDSSVPAQTVTGSVEVTVA